MCGLRGPAQRPEEAAWPELRGGGLRGRALRPFLRTGLLFWETVCWVIEGLKQRHVYIVQFCRAGAGRAEATQSPPPQIQKSEQPERDGCGQGQEPG